MASNNQPNNNYVKRRRLIFGVSVPVFLMGLVSLFTDISSESIQSILPLFIIEIGGSTLVLGLISGVTNAIANILKGITGWMSDKINKRKPFIVAGYSLSNLSKPLIGLSPSWEMVLGLKTTDRIGKGLRTSSRDALISYYAEKKGKAFGLHRAMDTLGAVFGSLLAFLLLFLAWSYSQIIFFSIIPGLIAVALIIPVKDISPEELNKKLGKKNQKDKKEKIDRNFIKLIVILGVIEFASLDVVFAQDYNIILFDFTKIITDYIKIFNSEFEKIKKILTKRSETIFPQEIKMIQGIIDVINEKYIHWRNGLESFVRKANTSLLKKQGYTIKKYKSISISTEKKEDIKYFEDDPEVIDLLLKFNNWVKLFNELELKYGNVIYYQKRLINDAENVENQKNLDDMLKKLKLI